MPLMKPFTKSLVLTVINYTNNKPFGIMPKGLFDFYKKYVIINYKVEKGLNVYEKIYCCLHYY
jgi:hypothetical protein